MALSRAVTALICDEQGAIATSFAQMRPKEWADAHMTRRYNAAVPQESDRDDHPARLCYDCLLSEFNTLRSWFDREGKLSRLLMSRSLGQIYKSPIGNGMGWDFKPNGDPEPRMLQFKGTLIACQRTLELRSLTKFGSGSAEVGGVAKLVRAAYQTRAEMATWEPEDEKEGGETVTRSGADMARRWIAFRTYNFLTKCGVEEALAWAMAKCKDAFGTLVT